MSKSIIIQEGGTPKSLTVDKLRTSTATSGYVDWVPEDETRLTTKHISENGTYNASDEGYYGYASVTVSGVGTAIGKDADGDDAAAYTDPETGQIVQEKLPASIVIETAPTKTTYSDGETIDLSGAVVKSYTENGELWHNDDMQIYQDGVIPIAQLYAVPDKADASQAISGEWDVTDTDLRAPIYFSQVSQGDTYVGIAGETSSRFITELHNSAPVYIFRFDYGNGINWDVGFISAEPFRCVSRRVAPPGWDPHWATDVGGLVTVGGNSAYVGGYSITYQEWNAGVSAKQDIDHREAAVIAFAGGTPIPGGRQPITVNWNRPRDFRQLTASFDISVVAEA